MAEPTTERSKKDLLSSLKYAAQKEFGADALLMGSDVPETPILCSTGSYCLDVAMGCLGIPNGRIFELFGPESSGKSTLALIMAASVQRNTGLSVGYIDVEYSFDKTWAQKLGVNTDDLLFFQPDFGDEAFTMAELMLKSQAVGLVIIDSVSALRPRAVVEGGYGDAHVGQQSRLMSQGLEKITPEVAKSKGSLIFINQIRQKIGVMYGNPETTSGGEALKFYSSVRWRVSRKEVLGPKDDPEGFMTKVKIVKNKCGRPFQDVELPLYIGKEKKETIKNEAGESIEKITTGPVGISATGEILDLASDAKIVKKKDKQTYYYNDILIGQGRENVIEILNNDAPVFNEIRTKVFTEVFRKADPSTPGSFTDEAKKEARETKKKEEKSKTTLVETNITDKEAESIPHTTGKA